MSNHVYLKKGKKGTISPLSLVKGSGEAQTTPVVLSTSRLRNLITFLTSIFSLQSRSSVHPDITISDPAHPIGWPFLFSYQIFQNVVHILTCHDMETFENKELPWHSHIPSRSDQLPSFWHKRPIVQSHGIPLSLSCHPCECSLTLQ